MKLEKRGKYPGVKIRLDEHEAKVFIDLAIAVKASQIPLSPAASYLTLSAQIGKSIKKMVEADPSVLAPRSEEEIAATLIEEAEKANLKLKALKKGEDWTGIKPPPKLSILNSAKGGMKL